MAAAVAAARQRDVGGSLAAARLWRQRDSVTLVTAWRRRATTGRPLPRRRPSPRYDVDCANCGAGSDDAPLADGRRKKIRRMGNDVYEQRSLAAVRRRRPCQRRRQRVWKRKRVSFPFLRQRDSATAQHSLAAVRRRRPCQRRRQRVWKRKRVSFPFPILETETRFRFQWQEKI